jgi:hypothetical protein
VARGTNDAYQGAQVAAQNLAARRGLSGEQAAAIGTPIEIARAGKIADAANQLPILGRQLQNEDLQLASSLAERFGKGTSMRGTSDTTQSGWSSGTSSGTTTAPPDISAITSLLMPQAPNQAAATGSMVSTGAENLGATLLSLFQAGAFGGGGAGTMPGAGGIQGLNTAGSYAPSGGW